MTTYAALGSVAGDDVVTDGEVGDTLTNTLNDTTTLVPKNGRELALGVCSQTVVSAAQASMAVGHAPLPLRV